MEQVPAHKRKQFRFCNNFIKGQAKEMFGQDVFSAIAKSMPLKMMVYPK